jgi:hypothetical protein
VLADFNKRTAVFAERLSQPRGTTKVRLRRRKKTDMIFEITKFFIVFDQKISSFDTLERMSSYSYVL